MNIVVTKACLGKTLSRQGREVAAGPACSDPLPLRSICNPITVQAKEANITPGQGLPAEWPGCLWQVAFGEGQNALTTTGHRGQGFIELLRLERQALSASVEPGGCSRQEPLPGSLYDHAIRGVQGRHGLAW